jgi:hypothetical protein
MPLKLANLKHPSSTSLLNRWADDKEQTLQQHQTQITKLQNQIDELMKQK